MNVSKILKMLGLGFVGILMIGMSCPDRLGTITGKVIDSITEEPLSGVTVSTEPATKSDLTDTKGEFNIYDIEPGEYTVKYHKEGYLEGEQTVFVREDEVVRADFAHRPMEGIIFGQITDVSTDLPIRGASVTTTPPTMSVTSDEDGNYTLGPIGVDPYTVTVTKPDYEDGVKSVTLEPGDEKRVDFQLIPSLAPTVTITYGPQDKPIIPTIPTSEVEFRWEGNIATVRYKYRVANSIYYSDFWKTDASSVLLKDLDESPPDVFYTFTVIAIAEDGRESTPDQRKFRVDAIHGPAVWIKPRRVEIKDVRVNPGFRLSLMAEEVSDLLLAHLIIRFDKDKLKVQPGGIEKGDFLTKNSDESHLVFFPSDIEEAVAKANSEGVLTMDMAILQKDRPPAVSGSGVLATLRFNAIVEGQTVSVRFDGETKLRDSENSDMTLTGRYGSTVEIK